MMKRIAIVLAVLATACGKTDSGGTVPKKPVDDPFVGTKAECYTSTKDWKKLFEKTELTSSKGPSFGALTLSYDDSKTFQTIDGFGAAMTWATCYNLMNMSPEDRHDVLKELFDKEEGLGISLVRVTIGASDFNYTNYTWCDKKGIENFAVHPSDEQYVFPALKEMFEINPDVRIIASPWSAPKWMKRVSYQDNSPYDSWTGGSLNNDFLDDYAQYFVKWIQEMEKRGFPIYAVTLQNEPLNNGNSISMGMTYSQQLKFIKEAVGPAFEKAGIKTKILVFDHNFDYDGQSAQKDYPAHIFSDPVASGYVAGSAWHNYSGQPSMMDNIISAYPDKEIYFTEATIGDWNYQNPGVRMMEDFKQIYMQMLMRGCRGVTLWNMVLDDKRGPFNPEPGSCKTSFGLVDLNASYRVKDRTSHYYCTAHTSKLIKQGAVRVMVSGVGYKNYDEMIQVYRNPDGTHAAIILNSANEINKLAIKIAEGYLELTPPAGSIISLKW